MRENIGRRLPKTDEWVDKVNATAILNSQRVRSADIRRRGLEGTFAVAWCLCRRMTAQSRHISDPQTLRGQFFWRRPFAVASAFDVANCVRDDAGERGRPSHRA
jgi:hypothetical protein